MQKYFSPIPVTYDETSPSCLRWGVSVFGNNGAKIVSEGDCAGSLTRHGYWVIGYKRKRIYAHRVVWEIANGALAEAMFIDHINGERSDNRLENLRVVSRATNQRNQGLRKNSTTKVCGVSLDRKFSNNMEYLYYKAYFVGVDGNKVSKSFSINKLGKEVAFEMATAWRLEMIENLNKDGAGYSERHGQ